MADCSKAVEFSRELYRLCYMEDDGHGAGCDTCPFNNEGERTCPFDRQITQDDVDIVQRWSNEHPIPKPKTYADYFFEKFPNAGKGASGIPLYCRTSLFGGFSDCEKHSCAFCWNEVMPE